MLKSLAVLALLLTVAQVPVPPHGIAVNDRSQDQTTPRANAKDRDKSSAPNALVSSQKVPTENPDSQRHLDEKQGHETAIASTEALPQMWRKREWFSFGTNLALAVVGIVGVVSALITLCFIKAQVAEMRRQRLVLKRTLDAIQRQASLMERQMGDTKNRGRARLVVTFPPDPPNFTDRFEEYPDQVPFSPSITVVNHGYTKAFDVRAVGSFTFAPSPEALVPFDGCELSVPNAIVENNEPIVVYLLGIGSFTMVSQHEIDKVRDEKSFFRVAGEIRYKDVYGDSHQTPFSHLWVESAQYEEEGWRDDSFWANQSAEAT